MKLSVESMDTVQRGDNMEVRIVFEVVMEIDVDSILDDKVYYEIEKALNERISRGSAIKDYGSWMVLKS